MSGMYEKHAPKQAIYEITETEEDILAQLAAIVYATGDIFYYDGSDIVKLGAGAEGQHLIISGGIPGWDDIAPTDYPESGIAVSAGTHWSDSIQNNSANWNTAYGWGNHASVGYLIASAPLVVTSGGTGLATIADGSVLAANAADTLSAVTYHDGGTKILTNTAGTISWEDNSGGGASTALDNLADVAINTTLLPASNDGAAIGSAVYAFSDVYLASAGVLNFAIGGGYVSVTNQTTVDTAGGNLNITAGDGNGTEDGGTIGIEAGSSGATGNGGLVEIYGGASIYATGFGGSVVLQGGSCSTHGGGGAIALVGGDGDNGGNVEIYAGQPSGAGTAGKILITDGVTSLGVYLDVSGITVAHKTITFPNADATLLYSGGALGTPASGTVTNLTGTASININGTVGASTPTTGVFTTVTTNTGLIPDANDGAYIGTGLLGFSDIFFASGGVINWNNGETTLTQATDWIYLNNSSFVIKTENNDTAASYQLTFRKKRFTTPFTVQNGDTLGAIYFNGYDSAAPQQGAYISAIVDGTPGANDMPTKLSFFTTPDGSVSPVERLGISNAGVITTFIGIVPDADDGAYLGQAGTAFSDLFLASGGVINWDSGDIAITHSANLLSFDGGYYKFTGTAPTIYKNVIGDYFDSYSAYDTASEGENRINFDRSRGNIASPTAVTLNTLLGTIFWKGHDGTDYEVAAGIKAFVDGTPGNDDMPGRLLFYTTPDDSKTPTERMRINNAGVITIPNGGNFMVGGATLETGSTNTIGIANGTAPDAHVDNQVIFFAADSADATSALGIYAEQAVEDIGTFTATKKFKINYNGVWYWIQLDPVA